MFFSDSYYLVAGLAWIASRYNIIIAQILRIVVEQVAPRRVLTISNHLSPSQWDHLSLIFTS